MDFKPRKSLHRIRSIDKNVIAADKILSYSLSKTKHKPLLKSNTKFRSTNTDTKIQRTLQVPDLSQKDTSRLMKAKDLYKQFKLIEAYHQFQQIIHSYPHHQECLYLMGVICINLQKSIEAAKYFQKLLKVSPNYKQNVYLLAAISLNKMKQTNKAIDILTKGIAKYEGFFEAYCYRAKLFISMNKISKAQEDYDKAFIINPRKQVVLIGKADCLRLRGEDKDALIYYNKALEQGFNQNVLLKRASMYYQMLQYSKCMDDINLLMQQPTSEILYYRGLLYLNFQHNESKAIISFQTAVKNHKAPTIQRCCLIQLLKLRINSCDFYECTNILQMAKLYNIKILSWSYFIQGVIALMKKKNKEADEEFNKLQKQLKVDSLEYQYLYPLNRQYHGYCYFSLFKYQKAYEYYVEYKTYVSTVLGKVIEDQNVVYNTNLFEALMLCDSDCFDDSLEKLNEIIDENKNNFELDFYRLMVMMKIAVSDDPILGQMDSKQEILLYVLELMPEVHEGANSPNLLYYEALLKTYFGIFTEAEKAINKAIQKAQQNLARLFQLRAIVDCQLGNTQQSINDLSICINIEEKAEYFRDRGRMYQLLGQSQQAYEDLQKYIELETNEEQISKWASILLFANRAYEEASRALAKIQNINNYEQLQQIKQLISLFEGKFEQSGVQGKVIQQLMKGIDDVGLDKLINNKKAIGYFPQQYTHFLRVILNYSTEKYSVALKDLQLLLFIYGSQQNRKNLVLEIKYCIMVCHFLNGDFQKAKNQYKGLTEIIEVVNKIQEALAQKQQINLPDLSEYFSYPHISTFLPFKRIPNTKINIKLSIPFPEPPVPNLDIKVTNDFLNERVKIQAVDGKGEAPWIRKNNKGKYQFTNQVISKQISVLSSLNNSVLM